MTAPPPLADPLSASTEAEPDPDLLVAEEEALLVALQHRYGYDFGGYARASLRRRLQLACTRLGCVHLSELQGRVLRDPELLRELVATLSVQTTEMFRDPSMWRDLREQVLPVLASYPEVRVWSAGCSTGEEVWSLAICLHEAGLLSRARVHATDLDAGALARAAEAVRPAADAQAWTAAYQRSGGSESFGDYYTSAYGLASIRPELLERVVFAQHNLATDSSFGRMHLILCRNVMIYFGQDLRARALGLFDGSLVRRGFLAVGGRETLRFSPIADGYEPVTPDARLYRKKP